MIYWAAGLVLGGALIWFLASVLERQKQVFRLNALENKFRFSENRALELQDKLAKVEQDANLLRQTFEEEKSAKDAALLRWHESVRQGTVIAALCLLAGIFGGGSAAWFLGTLTLEAKNNRRTSELEISTRIAEVKASLFEKQLTQLQSDYTALEKSWFETRVEKTVAETKLQILLDHLVVEKDGRGFALDYKRMKKDWEDQNKADQAGRNSKMVPLPIVRL